MRIIVLSLLLTVVFAVPAFSQMKDMPMKRHGMEHGQMMGIGHMDKVGDMVGMCLEHAGELGLTDDQITKMKPGHSEMQKKQARFVADMKVAEIELMDIMEVKDFDLEKASAIVKNIGDIKTAHHLEMIKAIKEVRAILTDDQFKKMKKLMPMKGGDKKQAKRMMKKRS